MKLFVLVRNTHDKELNTNFTISLYKTFDEAREQMKEEYSQVLNANDGNAIYTYNLYDDDAYIYFKSYNIDWEIQEKEIKED